MFLEKKNFEIELNLKTEVPQIWIKPGSPVYKEKNYFLKKNYIHHNVLGHKNLNAYQFDALQKLLKQKYFLNKDILLYALDCLEQIFGTTLKGDAFSIKLDLSKKYIKETKNHSIHIDPMFNKSLNGLYLKFFLENYDVYKDGFYYIYYYDFRGRFYTDSIVGYTNNAYMRYILNFGLYSPIEIDSFVLEDEFINIKNNFEYFKQKSFKNDLHVYVEILTLFELGKLIKSKAPNYNGMLTFADFITLGLNLVNDSSNLFNLEEIDLYNKYILIYRLKNSEDTYKYKYCFYKDATASGLQMLGLILKPKNDEVAKWLNFTDNNCWYDSYYYLINKFLQTYTIDEKYKIFFNRKTLKKSCMLFNYQASFGTCLTDFLNNIKTTLSPQDKNQVISIYKDFYKFLEKSFLHTEIFQHESYKLYWFLIYTNPNLLNTLKQLLQYDAFPLKLRSLFEKIINIDYSWFESFGFKYCEFDKIKTAQSNEFLNQINYHIELLKKPESYDVKLFINFIKENKLLLNLKQFYSKNKPVNSLTYSCIDEFPQLFTIPLIKDYLMFLQQTSTSVIDQFFYIKLGDGFNINYDYVLTTTEKFDYKIKYSTESEIFWDKIHNKFISIKPNLTYSHRSTFQTSVNTNDINFSKLESAFKANFIHSIDAYAIRMLIILSTSHLITIHDSFGCDILSLKKNTELIKNAYSNIHLKTNTPHSDIFIKNKICSNYIML